MAPRLWQTVPEALPLSPEILPPTSSSASAGSEHKSAFDYINQNKGGEYQPKEAVTVIQRGSVSVICSQGEPVIGGDVYVRKVADESGKNIGDFEAVADGEKSVKLTNAQWGGSADVNGVAELVLLTRNRA